MNLTKWVGVVALTLVAGVVGYQVGARNASNDSKTDPAVAETTQATDLEQSVVEESLQPIQSDATSPSVRPALSIQEIFDIKDDQDRWQLTREYFDGLTSENVELYLADIAELPPSMRKGQLYSALFSKWAEIDGPAAFAYAKTMKGQDRSGYLSAVATSWAKKNPTEAWEALMIATDYGKLSAGWAGGVITSIAQNDLREAYKLAADYRSGSRISFTAGGKPMGYGMGMLIRSAEQSGQFQELQAILVEESDPKELNNNLEALYQTWGKYEFETPLAQIEAMEDGERSRSAMTGFLQGWAAADGSEALQYALENQDNDTVASALPGIATSVVRGATADEIDEILDGISKIENKDALTSGSFLWTLGSVNPEAGIQIANQVTDTKKREQGIRSVTSNWARNDLSAADEYVRSIEDETIRKTATGSIIYTHVNEQTDPKEILSLADGYSDPKHTGNILSNIVSNALSDRNKDKTQALLKELRETLPDRTDLPDETKQKLIERLNN